MSRGYGVPTGRYLIGASMPDTRLVVGLPQLAV